MKKYFLLFAAFFLVSFKGSPEDILTLEKSIEIALKNNIKLNIADEKIRQSEFAGREVSTSFFPRFSASFNYTRLAEPQEVTFGPFPPILLDPVSYAVTDDDLFNLSLGVTQVLFTGGRRTSLYRKSVENIKLTGYAKDAVGQDVAYEVKKSYFSVLKLRRLLENALSLRDMAEQHLKVTEALFNEGLVTKVDILKTEVFLSDAQQAIIKAESGLESAESAFNFTLNRPLDTKVDIEDMLTSEKELHTPDYWKNLAFEKHPDLKIAGSSLRMSGFSVSAARSGYYPQLAAFYNYTFDRGTQDAIDRWRNTWNAGLAVEMDIWNWGETAYRVSRAKHQEEEVREQGELLRKGIELSVHNAYTNIETARKEIETSAKTIEKAQENFRIAEMLYREGMATNTEVLDAQTDLAGARNNYYQALCDYHIAYAELEKAAGVTE